MCKLVFPVSETSRKISFRFTVGLCGFLAPTVILDGMVLDVQNQKPEGELVMLTGITQIWQLKVLGVVPCAISVKWDSYFFQNLKLRFMQP